MHITIILTLATGLVTLTSGLPTSPSTSPAASLPPFQPREGQGHQCIEMNAPPALSTATSAPLLGDCLALVAAYPSDGFWTVAASQISRAGAWATVASAGTCAFKVSLDQGVPSTAVLVGTKDLAYYLTNWKGSAREGRLGAQGTVACNKVGQTGMVSVVWAMARV